jgi:hypothetical protein
MAFFSDLWNGAKQVFGGIGRMVDSILDVLFEGIFWLVDKIFDAVEALFDFIDTTIDSIIESVGSFFTSKDKDGEGGVLPIVDEVQKIAEKYDKEYGTDYHRKTKKGIASIAYVQDGNGKIQGAKFVGSEKGFGTQIAEAHKRNRIFATKIKDQ